MFHRILAATALPDRIDPPVISALKLAAAHRAELVVLHVLPYEPGEKAAFIAWPETDSPSGAETHQALACLQRQYQRYRQIYAPLRFRTGRGTAWEAIAETARGIDADAIILGPHEPERHLKEHNDELTGTAQGLLHNAVRPVVITGRNMSIRMTWLKTIVVCIDFSESCRLALLLAARLAREHDSKIYLLHVHGIPPFPGYTQRHYLEDTRRLTQHLDIFAHQNAPGLTYEPLVLGGSQPHLEILRFARNRRADLVIMGSGAGSQQHKWYVGSAVENVSRSSFCPVAVVPILRSGPGMPTD